jgi:hypothetical protein
MVLNGITTERLADRRALLASFDRFRRDVDSSGLMAGLDGFNEQAFGMLTSSRLLEALNVEKESAALRERYGKGDAKVHGDAAPMLNEQFLIARRLVEAGARFVTVAYGFWDYHGNNFGNARNDLPLLWPLLPVAAAVALLNPVHRRLALFCAVAIAAAAIPGNTANSSISRRFRTPSVNRDIMPNPIWNKPKRNIVKSFNLGSVPGGWDKVEAFIMLWLIN